MPAQHPASHPFALMMDPAIVVEAMQSSERLNRLTRRVCRPLDKPLIPRAGSERDEFDKAVDALPEADETQ